jgi:hypothetical protein
MKPDNSYSTQRENAVKAPRPAASGHILSAHFRAAPFASTTSIFEHLLDVSSFPLEFPSHLLPFAPSLNVLVVRHFPKTFFHPALHLAHLAFCLIDRAIFHIPKITRLRQVSMSRSPDIHQGLLPTQNNCSRSRRSFFVGRPAPFGRRGACGCARSCAARK